MTGDTAPVAGGTPGGGLRSWPMPKLIRFVVLHAAIGWVVAAVFMAALLATDPGGIGSLLLRSQEHPLPVLLLWFFTGLTFGSAQVGAAVMLLASDRPRPPGGGVATRAMAAMRDRIGPARPAARRATVPVAVRPGRVRR